MGFRDLDGSRALVLWMLWGVHVLGIGAAGPGCARRGWGVGWEGRGDGERGGACRGLGRSPSGETVFFSTPCLAPPGAWAHS